ncbi:sensor domain-containing diguanylate cyclase [Balneatrix alpica]|uniref:diguanylate cyclase n=2 Tax=Balneatrix alpica TaxID=75684 RepID=A0ABV5ZD25_9GAMM|nr:sensor domain-containing diguanylate cyclase [Balneatrix alpica]
MYLLRLLACSMQSIACSALLWEQQSPWWMWWGILGTGVVWPHLARRRTLRHSKPYLAERQHVLIDNLIGAVVVALLGFSLVPSVILFTILMMESGSVGGQRFMLKSLGSWLLGLPLGALISGGLWLPQSSLLVSLAALPMLLTCSLASAIITYAQARHLNEQKNQFRELSRRDGLTGLFNRLYWEEMVAMHFLQCGGKGVLAMLDIDHFKKINDQHGHRQGDEALRLLAEVLQQQVKAGICGRYGGEEFGILWREISREEAIKQMQRVRREYQQRMAAQGLESTLSVGMVAAEVGWRRYDDWIEAADQMLYRAKDDGRDRLACWEEAA